MTEDDYITASDLARLRMAAHALNECLAESALRRLARLIVQYEAERLAHSLDISDDATYLESLRRAVTVATPAAMAGLD